MKLLLICVVTFCSLAGFAQQPSTSSQSPTSQAEPATTTAATTQPSTQTEIAKVYFYRYKQYAGSALSPSVYCDEAELARMENGRYFTVKLAPGKHTFRSNDKQSGVEVDLKPGQEYFLRVELVAGFMKGHGRVVAVMPEQARFELKAKNLKPLDADKVTDKERVSTEPVTFGEAEKASK
ncbi:MAG TPA: DUF2846 domain-containing protein [Candidatus Angelobacter sp.]|nr:DUF2846 domain-containing protein [Candidatus Angelobacter sp.]